MEKVAHNIKNPLTDLIVGDETGQFPQAIDAPNLALSQPGVWWLETDRNGELWLCRYAAVGTAAFVDCTDAQGQNNYTAVAQDFIGVRPSGRPPTK